MESISAYWMRLRTRSAALVKQHFRTATSVSAGLASLPALIEPPRDLARQTVNGADYGSRYVLVAHDWSKLMYTTHTSKPDQVEVSHGDDLGYELTPAG